MITQAPAASRWNGLRSNRAERTPLLAPGVVRPTLNRKKYLCSREEMEAQKEKVK